MAEGEQPDYEIIPTRDTGLFHFRARLSSLEDPRPAGLSTVIAGRKCTAFYSSLESNPRLMVAALRVNHDPVLERATKVSAHMVLLDKTGSPAPSMGKGKALASVPGCTKGGYALLARWDDVKANCVVDNYFVVRCSVHIDWSSSLEEQLPDLGHDLAMMSDKQNLTDISFDVGGESFSAHRLVLAARSPVFRAQLYGQMAESKMTSITIQDMEASTFRSMLHYIYHGSLPDASRKDVSSTMAQYQHVLVAADRYGLDGLKKICEDKLCGSGITTENVVSMLELAEDHVCAKLKARCFDFLADGDNLKMVAISDEYIRLMQTFPNLLVEVRDRIKIALEESTTMNPSAHKKSRLC